MNELRVPAPVAPVAPSLHLLSRERSILEFNRRVLAQARRADVPLLERLRYIPAAASPTPNWKPLPATPMP